MNTEPKTHTEQEAGRQRPSPSAAGAVTGLRVRPRGEQAAGGGRRTGTHGNRLIPSPGRLRTPGGARAGPATPLSRRSLALADDAAFRERARLLAALERRHWLNSYMHKLLVLDAP